MKLIIDQTKIGFVRKNEKKNIIEVEILGFGFRWVLPLAEGVEEKIDMDKVGAACIEFEIDDEITKREWTDKTTGQEKSFTYINKSLKPSIFYGIRFSK